MENNEFTHVDSNNRPRMVDVGDKELTNRVAIARSIISVPENVLKHFSGEDINTKKGPVFQTAIIAGTMAVKRTHELIPFCHPVPIEGCDFKINVVEDKILIECKVRSFYKTGIEMEALTGANLAALTIYDMCKALSHEIVIESTQLISKTGGKSDYQKA